MGPPQSLRHGAEPQLDLVLGLVGSQALQLGVRPGVGADRMAAARHLLHHFRVGDRHAADHEERRLGAVGVEGLEDGAV